MSTENSRCYYDLHDAGVPHPRTCEECGMGPCKRGRFPDDKKATTPTPAHPGARKITETELPVFPCWLWIPEWDAADGSKYGAVWIKARDASEVGPFMGGPPEGRPKATHWLPGTAPRPEGRPEGEAHDRIMSICEEARHEVGKLPYGGRERQALHDAGMKLINAAPQPAATEPPATGATPETDAAWRLAADWPIATPVVHRDVARSLKTRLHAAEAEVERLRPDYNTYAKINDDNVSLRAQLQTALAAQQKAEGERDEARKNLGPAAFGHKDGIYSICLGFHPETNEYEWLQAVAASDLAEARATIARLTEEREGKDAIIERQREILEFVKDPNGGPLAIAPEAIKAYVSTLRNQAKASGPCEESPEVLAMDRDNWRNEANSLRTALRSATERTERAERDRDDLRRQRDALLAYKREEFWIWQGDGTDYIESLTCRILIPAPELRSLFARLALADGLAKVLDSIPPCNVAGDASFVFQTTGGRWCEWMDKRNAALTAYRAASVPPAATGTKGVAS